MRNFQLLSVLLFSFSSFAFNHVEPQVAWNKKAVKVCFATKEHFKTSEYSRSFPKLDAGKVIQLYTTSEKTIVKNAVNREYDPKETGIHFTGWADCKDSPDSDAYLFKITDKEQDILGRATIGQGGYSSHSHGPNKECRDSYLKIKNAKKPYVLFNTSFLDNGKLTRTQRLERTILHEFGHLAGLRHEHPDAPEIVNRKGETLIQDLNCVATSGPKSYTETYSYTTKKYSTYDANSIMNYCFNRLQNYTGLELLHAWDEDMWFALDDTELFTSDLNQQGRVYKMKIGLSQGDQHALKCLYTYDSKKKAEICRPNYDPRKKIVL